MSLRKALLCIFAGFVFAVLVIGLMPFLTVYSWSEMTGLSELYSSPLMLLNKLYRKNKESSAPNKK